MTEALAYKAGAAFGFLFCGVCIAGQDTRVSGASLLDAFVAGLNSAGGNALTVGIVPTPALALLVKKRRAAGGVMVSASHNPPEYNGLKLFGRGGAKLSAKEEEAVEFYIDNPDLVAADARGWVSKMRGAAEIYINDIVLGSQRLDGEKVWLDCGFGAAGAFVLDDGQGSIAREVFTRLGASVVCLNEGGDGNMINVDCGALYAERLLEAMKGNFQCVEHCELNNGFAFDGDADRMVMVFGDEILDGDSVLYALSRHREGGVVGTVMSNLALKRRVEADRKAFFAANVGDKHILELMLRKKCGLGGEQSGHYILYPERTTGDGLLAAVKMAGLRGEIERLRLVPQKTVSLPCRCGIMQSSRLRALTREAEGVLSRVLVRLSGTEPKIRIMAEDEDEGLVDRFLERFKTIVDEQNT